MKKFLVFAVAALMALASCTKEGNLDGKWNAAHPNGAADDPALSLIFDGSKLDLYINSYGWHFEGTYTYTNSVIDYKITKGYAALSNVEKDENGKIIGYHGGIDAVDHKTLELNAGFAWYDMLDYREDLYADYTDMLSKFRFEMIGDGTAQSDILGMGGTFTKVK